MDSKDYVALSMTSKVMMKKCEHILSMLTDQCQKESRLQWHYLDIRLRQSIRCVGGVRFCGGCHTIVEDDFICISYPWKVHRIKLDYFHFPRDVDILTTYYNGKKCGYTTL